MGLSNVNIELQNGGLGAAPLTNDGVTGIVVSGVAITGDNAWAIGQVKSFRSLPAVEAAGITEAYDTANSTNAWRQIKDWYAMAKDGKKLYVMLVANTETLADICLISSTNKYAKKLIDAANGELRMLIACRKPAAGYTPTYTGSNTINDEVLAAITNAEALVQAYRALKMPLRIIIENIYFKGGTPVPAPNTKTCPGVVLVTGDYVQDKSAFAGLFGGAQAAVPVQRKASRIKNGALPFEKAWISSFNGTTWSYVGVNIDGDTLNADVTSIHDAGSVTVRTLVGRTGYFFTGCPTCSPVANNDYQLLTRCLVIDKASRIAYDTLVNELDDDVDTVEGGKLSPVVISGYERQVENAVSLGMQNEISEVTMFIDPDQNVLSDEQWEGVLKIRPKGYSKTIDVKLGFTL